MSGYLETLTVVKVIEINNGFMPNYKFSLVFTEYSLSFLALQLLKVEKALAFLNMLWIFSKESKLELGTVLQANHEVSSKLCRLFGRFVEWGIMGKSK